VSLHRDTVRRRLRLGWTVEEARSTPPRTVGKVNWTWTPDDARYVAEHGPATRAELSERLGITQEAIRQIEARALESVRRVAHWFDLGPEWFDHLHHRTYDTDAAEVEHWPSTSRLDEPAPMQSDTFNRLEALLCDVEARARRLEALLAPSVLRR
jgi:hypothetical protein